MLSPSELTLSATSDDGGLEFRILEGASLELHVRRAGTYTLQLDVAAELEQGATLAHGNGLSSSFSATFEAL